MDQEACPIELYLIHRHVCWSFTKQLQCYATSSSCQTSPPSHVFNYVVICRLMRLGASSNVCNYWTQLSGMQCTFTLEQQTSLFMSLPPVCMAVLLSPDQQPKHQCHTVSRYIYHHACLRMWQWTSTRVWNQAVMSVTASRETSRAVAVPMFLNVCF